MMHIKINKLVNISYLRDNLKGRKSKQKILKNKLKYKII